MNMSSYNIYDSARSLSPKPDSAVFSLHTTLHLQDVNHNHAHSQPQSNFHSQGGAVRGNSLDITTNINLNVGSGSAWHVRVGSLNANSTSITTPVNYAGTAAYSEQSFPSQLSAHARIHSLSAPQQFLPQSPMDAPWTAQTHALPHTIFEKDEGILGTAQATATDHSNNSALFLESSSVHNADISSAGVGNYLAAAPSVNNTFITNDLPPFHAIDSYSDLLEEESASSSASASASPQSPLPAPISVDSAASSGSAYGISMDADLDSTSTVHSNIHQRVSSLDVKAENTAVKQEDVTASALQMKQPHGYAHSHLHAHTHPLPMMSAPFVRDQQAARMGLPVSHATSLFPQAHMASYDNMNMNMNVNMGLHIPIALPAQPPLISSTATAAAARTFNSMAMDIIANSKSNFLPASSYSMSAARSASPSPASSPYSSSSSSSASPLLSSSMSAASASLKCSSPADSANAPSTSASRSSSALSLASTASSSSSFSAPKRKRSRIDLTQLAQQFPLEASLSSADDPSSKALILARFRRLYTSRKSDNKRRKRQKEVTDAVRDLLSSTYLPASGCTLAGAMNREVESLDRLSLLEFSGGAIRRLQGEIELLKGQLDAMDQAEQKESFYNVEFDADELSSLGRTLESAIELYTTERQQYELAVFRSRIIFDSPHLYFAADLMGRFLDISDRVADNYKPFLTKNQMLGKVTSPYFVHIHNLMACFFPQLYASLKEAALHGEDRLRIDADGLIVCMPSTPDGKKYTELLPASLANFGAHLPMCSRFNSAMCSLISTLLERYNDAQLCELFANALRYSALSAEAYEWYKDLVISMPGIHPRMMLAWFSAPAFCPTRSFLRALLHVHSDSVTENPIGPMATPFRASLLMNRGSVVRADMLLVPVVEERDGRRLTIAYSVLIMQIIEEFSTAGLRNNLVKAIDESMRVLPGRKVETVARARPTAALNITDMIHLARAREGELEKLEQDITQAQGLSSRGKNGGLQVLYQLNFEALSSSSASNTSSNPASSSSLSSSTSAPAAAAARTSSAFSSMSLPSNGNVDARHGNGSVGRSSDEMKVHLHEFLQNLRIQPLPEQLNKTIHTPQDSLAQQEKHQEMTQSQTQPRSQPEFHTQSALPGGSATAPTVSATNFSTSNLHNQNHSQFAQHMQLPHSTLSSHQSFSSNFSSSLSSPFSLNAPSLSPLPSPSRSQSSAAIPQSVSVPLSDELHRFLSLIPPVIAQGVVHGLHKLQNGNAAGVNDIGAVSGFGVGAGTGTGAGAGAGAGVGGSEGGGVAGTNGSSASFGGFGVNSVGVGLGGVSSSSSTGGSGFGSMFPPETLRFAFFALTGEARTDEVSLDEVIAAAAQQGIPLTEIRAYVKQKTPQMISVMIRALQQQHLNQQHQHQQQQQLAQQAQL